ncbi:hypothetical protein [Sporolactobacillus laevolacticus]|uniref:Uncharacterized protein n=1 Tax=Sporolactobacillus laevolacticus DSM 442 TaxID=1395513 RepID=V6IXH5_9BACL|nr:hypothetical protein [Sporolactobacillus laevolacticus]EST12000.1 hypothetical protein P343_09915 [Sporolactobacillus laevolacticus DSM 442]
MQKEYQSQKIDLFVGMIAEMVSEYIDKERYIEGKEKQKNG